MGNFSLGEAILGTGVDLSGLSSGLSKAEKQTGGVFDTLGNLAGGLGKVLAAGAVAGIGLIGAGLGLALNEAMGAQEVMAQTEAVIKSTGGAAGMSAAQISELAGSLSLTSRFSDDAIQEGENLLLTFTNIGSDVFPMATQSLVDMAAAMKTDVKGGAIQLGKALNDPIAGISALSRVGVTFTEDQKKVIEKLVETGQTAEAQKIILAELNREFGGSAAAAAGTAAGQLDVLKNQFLNIAEGIGLQMLPALQSLTGTVLPQLMPVIQAVGQAAADWVTGTLVPAFMNAVNWVVANWPAIQAKIMEFWAAAQPILQAAGDFIVNTLVPAFMNAVNWVVTNWPMIQAKIAEVWAAAQPILQAAGDFLINTVIPAFNQAVQWVVTNWPMIQAKIAEVMAQVQAVISTVLGAIKTFWDTWGGDIKRLAAGVFDYLSLIFSAFSKAFAGDWRGFGEDLRKAWDLLWAGIQELTGKAIDWFSTQDWGAIGAGIIDGISAGIEAAAGALAAAAKAAADAAIKAVKGFLGMHSPSRVGIDIGQNFGLSQADGILSTLPDIRYAAQMAGTAMSYSNTISVDARYSSDPAAVEAAGYRGARRALAEAGQAVDSRRRTMQ